LDKTEEEVKSSVRYIEGINMLATKILNEIWETIGPSNYRISSLVNVINMIFLLI
jgi:hypothetical protein